MDDAKGYRISSFPKDGNFWRIDWMSNVHLNPHARSEQLITVFLTKLLTPTSNIPINPLDNHNLTKDHVIAEIGVGILPLVWNGSVWKDGYFVKKQIKHAEGKFRINTAQAQFIDLSHSITVNGTTSRVIPAFQYPLGLKTWSAIKNSPLIALPYKGDPLGLLIPAIEVIRFYYIYSSCSARALFFGQYSKLASVPPIVDPISRIVTIILHWFAKRHDAWSLARHAASPLMQDRAIHIHKWVQLEALNQCAVMPSCTSFFPFDEQTTLSAYGKSIVGEDGITRFLATKLNRCTARMPFSEVYVELEDKPKSPEEVEERTPIWVKIWPQGLSRIPKDLDHSEEVNKKYFRKDIGVFEKRFTALNGKKLHVSTKKSDKTRGTIIVEKSDEAKKGVGTSGGTYGKSDLAPVNVRVDVSPSEDGTANTNLDYFIDALAYLRNNKSMAVTTKPVGINHVQYRGEILSHFPIRKSKRQWTSVLDGGKPIPRGIVIAEVVRGQRIGYAMEMERKPGKNENFSVLILAKSNHARMTTIELDGFIEQCMIHNRWPPKNELRSYRRISVSHMAGLGERIASAFDEIGI